MQVIKFNWGLVGGNKGKNVFVKYQAQGGF